MKLYKKGSDHLPIFEDAPKEEEEPEEDLPGDFQEPDDDEDELPPIGDDYGEDLGDDFAGEIGNPPLEKHADLLKELVNFDPYTKETFNNWLGITWNEEEGKFKPNPLIKPVMNLQGAAWCIGLLKTYARKNNIMTNISYDEYKNMLSDHIEAIWLNLGTRNDLGIKEDGDLIRVANELEHAAGLALMGAGEGKYTKFLGTTYSHHTSGQQQPMNMQQPQMELKKTNTFENFVNVLKGKK